MDFCVLDDVIDVKVSSLPIQSIVTSSNTAHTPHSRTMLIEPNVATDEKQMTSLLCKVIHARTCTMTSQSFISTIFCLPFCLFLIHFLQIFSAECNSSNKNDFIRSLQKTLFTSRDSNLMCDVIVRSLLTVIAPLHSVTDRFVFCIKYLIFYALLIDPKCI